MVLRGERERERGREMVRTARRGGQGLGSPRARVPGLRIGCRRRKEATVSRQVESVAALLHGGLELVGKHLACRVVGQLEVLEYRRSRRQPTAVRGQDARGDER
jgi:hypothetical protein